MAWFRRKRDEPQHDDEPAISDETPAFDASSGGPGGDVIGSIRARAGDWMAMPPIKPTIGSAPSLFHVQRTSEMMTTRRPVAFLGDLGHRVSPAAPSGSVHGLATTIQPPAEGRSGSAPQAAAAAALPLRTPARPHDDDLAGAAPASGGIVAADHLPVIQREISVAPAPTGPGVRGTMPEPAPSRVLREPALAPRPAERPAPPIAVVGDLPEPGDRRLTGGRSDDAVVTPAAPVAPLTTALPEAPVPAGTTGGASGATGIDLPLAAPVTERPTAERPPDLMPPIQSRAVQRRADSAQASRPAQPSGELPPLPSWATAHTAPATPPGSASAASMPLQARAVQRESIDSSEGSDEPGGAAARPPVAAEDETGSIDAGSGGGTAPLTGDTALRSGAVLAAPVEDDDLSPAGPDLPLHAAAAVQTEREASSATPALAEPADAAPAHEPDGDRRGDHGSSDPAEIDQEPVAPLLGDRPLQLQRSTDAAPRPDDGPRRPDLPLVVDAGAQPAGVPVPQERAGAAVAGPPPLGASAHALPLQRQTVNGSSAGPGAATAATSAGATPSPRTLPVIGDGGPRSARIPSADLAGPLQTISPQRVGKPPVAGNGEPRNGATGRALTVQTLHDAAGSAPVRSSALPLQQPVPPVTSAPDAVTGDTARSFDSAIAAGLATRQPDGSVVFSQQAPPSVDGFSVQREAAGSSSTSAHPASAASPAATTGVVVQRTKEEAKGGDAAGDPEADLDRLVKKLYPRIRSKLESDLRHERGRFGGGSINRFGR